MNEALVSDLSSMETIRDADKCLRLLDQVDNLLETNRMDIQECASLFKLTASNNAKVKCRVWNLMVKVCEQDKDFSLMLIASLNKDLADPNPLIRSSSLGTLASIPGLDQFAIPAIRQGLEDDNPAVRIAAVTGVGKLWLHSPSSVQEHNMIDDLYAALRDLSSTVIVFTLQTLAFLLEKTGGIVMTRKMVSHFLSRLHTFPDQEYCCLAEYLPACKRDIDSVLDILNEVDRYLDSKDANIVLATAKLLTQLVHPHHSQLEASLTNRLSPVISKWIRQAKRDFQYDLIQFALTLGDQYFNNFAKEKDLIKIKSKDSEDLKAMKIEFLLKLATADSCREIMNMLLNLLPSTSKLNSLIVQASCDVSQLDVQVRLDCIKNLDLLVKSEPARFLPVILEADLLLDPFLDKDNKPVNDLIQTILSKTNAENCPKNCLPHLLNLLKDFGSVTKNSPYLLEDLFRHHVTPPQVPAQKSADLSFSHVTTAVAADIAACFLSAAVALFDAFPAVMQPILGEIMHSCAKINDYQLRLQVQSYYKILLMKSKNV